MIHLHQLFEGTMSRYDDSSAACLHTLPYFELGRSRSTMLQYVLDLKIACLSPCCRINILEISDCANEHDQSAEIHTRFDRTAAQGLHVSESTVEMADSSCVWKREVVCHAFQSAANDGIQILEYETPTAG